MYLHECLSRNLWHLHHYHFSFLSIISLVHSHHRQNQRLNFFWSQSTITILCIIDIILLTRMAVVTALINVIGYKRLVSGGNKTLCKHNREPPYLPATMSIKVKMMMGETLFWKSVNKTFSVSTKRNKMENSTTSCAAGDRFALSSLPGHNLQNPYLGVSPKIIITSHITKMIKTLPNIQHCDHLQSHLFQPSLHWPPCKQGRSWQVWKWKYDVLIIVIMIKGCPHHRSYDQRMSS